MIRKKHRRVAARGRGEGRERLLERISSAVLIPRVRTHERNGAVSAARRD